MAKNGVHQLLIHQPENDEPATLHLVTKGDRWLCGPTWEHVPGASEPMKAGRTYRLSLCGLCARALSSL